MFFKINIIVRTFNEEDWIKFCLTNCLAQTNVDFAITVVDSGSTDNTLNIVDEFRKQYPTKIFVKRIEHFRPGNALNIGAREVESEYFVCLSAHCLPTTQNWLHNFVVFMDLNGDVAGAYGRQLPLSCTHPDDCRDLLITFGNEQQVYAKNTFFHNANSIVRRSAWVANKFDDDVPHIEDQVWAKAVISEGYKIAYLPDAAVFHYHGIHQHGKQKSFRASNVAKLMRQIEDPAETITVSSVLQETINTPIIVLAPSKNISESVSSLSKIQEEFQDEGNIYYISDYDESVLGVTRVAREELNVSDDTTFRDMLRSILEKIESIECESVDALIIFDLNYTFIDVKFGKKCKKLLFDHWLPAVMPAWKDFGNYWYCVNGNYNNIYNSLEHRSNKPAVFRSVVGQGAAIRASAIRSAREEIEQFELIWTEDAKICVRR